MACNHTRNCTVSTKDLVHTFNLVVTVAGDDISGYRAIAVGLVVAVAALSAASSHCFVQHLQQLYCGMQGMQGLLQFNSACGGFAHCGYKALLVCPLSVNAIE